MHSEIANPLAPVVGVSWYEAEAYCNWLTEKLGARGWRLEVWRDGQLTSLQLSASDLRCRLPTEEEWERAARGTNGREYPWGEQFDAALCNLKIGPHPARGTTAVCTYPGGASPDGVCDCSGNVWEWTGSWYQEGTYRVLRGGSWAINDEWYARCPYTLDVRPAYFDVNYGFRPMVDSPSPLDNF